MTRDIRPLDPDLEALFESARVIRPAPDVVRARVLAWARANVAAAEALPAARTTAAPPPRARRLVLALAASLAMTAGAVGTAAALFYRGHKRPMVVSPISAEVAPHAEVPAIDRDPPAPGSLARSAPRVRNARVDHALRLQESYAAELDLLQRAQAANTGGRFFNALSLLNEHGRRFPQGRLAEEREALRVRALVASGRTEDARAAAAAFTQRFPRSVLLPRLQETATAGH